MSETVSGTVLVLVGSLRAASVNRQLAELAVETAPDGVTLEVFDRLGELMVHVIGVEQRHQCGGLGVEVAGGVRSVEQDANVAVVQHHRCVEPHLRVTADVGEQGMVGVDELQSLPTVGE